MKDSFGGRISITESAIFPISSVCQKVEFLFRFVYLPRGLLWFFLFRWRSIPRIDFPEQQQQELSPEKEGVTKDRHREKSGENRRKVVAQFDIFFLDWLPVCVFYSLFLFHTHIHRHTSTRNEVTGKPGPALMSEPQSSLLLKKQLAELSKNPVEGFSAGLIDDNDIFRWEVLIIGPPDTLYEGGFFKAHLHFPKEYPLRPPRMKFVTEIWHPNIDRNGDVCISILHEPGDDKWGYEKASERWLPVHTVETILISVISMLADPNDESPANVDAAKEWREAYPEFKRKVARCVRKSQEEC